MIVLVGDSDEQKEELNFASSFATENGWTLVRWWIYLMCKDSISLSFSFLMMCTPMFWNYKRPFQMASSKLLKCL